MSAQVCCTPLCGPFPTAAPPQVAPQPRSYSLFHHITHTVLQGCDEAPGSPQHELMDLKVFDGSSGSSIKFTLKNTDTVDTLMKKYLQVRPELVGDLHLAYNGKQVSKRKSLSELGVKPGATFITYQKCVGG